MNTSSSHVGTALELFVSIRGLNKKFPENIDTSRGFVLKASFLHSFAAN
jgi:hypothetical protein